MSGVGMDGGRQLRWFAEELVGKGREDRVWPRCWELGAGSWVLGVGGGSWELGAGSCARSGWGGREAAVRTRVGHPSRPLAEQTQRTGGGWPGVRLLQAQTFQLHLKNEKN